MSRFLDRLSPLAAAAALVAFVLPGAAPAQDAEREPGEPYVAEVFTDWELRCITAPRTASPNAARCSSCCWTNRITRSRCSA
jgi:invasion protein IalB